MKKRFFLARAATLSVLSAGLVGAAYAEEAFRNEPSGSFATCRFGADAGGCAHFQGYVYVRRGPAAPRALAADGKASPAADAASLGAGRLYIHLDGAEAR